MGNLVSFENVLFAVARRNRKARGQHAPIARWTGFSGSSGTTRRYRCYVCDVVVDTDSAKHRPTVHAREALAAHAEAHVYDLVREAAPELWLIPPALGMVVLRMAAEIAAEEVAEAAQTDASAQKEVAHA